MIVMIHKVPKEDDVEAQKMHKTQTSSSARMRKCPNAKPELVQNSKDVE